MIAPMPGATTPMPGSCTLAKGESISQDVSVLEDPAVLEQLGQAY